MRPMRILASLTRSFAFLLALALGCGGDEAGKPGPASAKTPAAAPQEAALPTTPADLDQALVLGLAGFPAAKKGATGPPEPLPARMEFLVRRGGSWEVVAVEDPDRRTTVFHKVMEYPAEGGARLLTVSGSQPQQPGHVKLWEKQGGALEPETLWEENFGGNFSRMRDVEVGDLYGDGAASLAVATHDQGIVATLRPGETGFEVSKLDEEPTYFVHEIEVGDLDGDDVLEVYATPSEPNRLDGREQTGHVVRYVPATGEGRVVVAELGDRHAKEILVDDVDGDGRDELYVVVEGKVNPKSKALEKGVEVWRYDAGTPADGGKVVAEIRDRQARFLTAGDIEGDGSKELVLAGMGSGLWLIRPEPGQEPWPIETIDRRSGGFEHASILSDLDGDGAAELYVASDKDKEVRRYVWNGEKLVREVIYVRPDDRSVFTWNLMPVTVDLVPDSDQLAQ